MKKTIKNILLIAVIFFGVNFVGDKVKYEIYGCWHDHAQTALQTNIER